MNGLAERYYRLWMPVLSIVLLFGTAELVCRIFNLDRLLNADFKFYIRSVDNDIEHDFNTEDPFLMWSPQPGYDDGIITINSDGFRGREYERRKPENTFRILCLGESSTFGLGVPVDDAYPAILEAKLNSEYGSRGLHFEVINGGVTGFSSLQSLLLYTGKGAKYQPDIVTFCGGTNDAVKRFYLNDREIIKPRIPSFIRVLQRDLLFKLDSYRLFRKFIVTVLGLDNSVKDKAVYRQPPEDFKRNIVELGRACASNNATLILISPPFSTEKKRLRFKEIYRKELDEVVKTNKLDFIDIVDLSEESRIPNEQLFVDPGHPNKLGHTLIAEKIKQYLNDNMLLPAAARQAAKVRGNE